MTYKYCNSGNDVAIFRVGDVPEHHISLPDFKQTERRGIMYDSENIWN